MEAQPNFIGKERIKAKLDKKALARAIAHLVRNVPEAIETNEKEFSVHIDLEIRIKDGRMLDKLAKISLYTELTDPYGTSIIDMPTKNEVPTEFFKNFCDPVG